MTPRRGLAAVTLLALVTLAYSSADMAARVDDALPHLPASLAETGLYADGQVGRIAPGVRAFSPQYPLWSDGAVKRRWIWLPPGTMIFLVIISINFLGDGLRDLFDPRSRPA